MPLTSTARPGDAVHERLVKACQALVKALLPNATLFPGLTPGQVLDQLQENPAVAQFPAVLFSVEGQRETYEAVDYFDDAVTRPVLAAVVDRNDPTYTPPRGKYLQWRQGLLRAFRVDPAQFQLAIQSLVPEATGLKIDPDPLVDRESKVYQYFRSGVLLKFRCIEPRGVAAQTGN